jgi:lysophospholipase L1-like esterase
VSRAALLAAAALALAVLPAPDPAAAQTKYIAFGDSITNPGGSYDDPSRPCPEECGYPGRLEDLLQGAGIAAEVVNAGLGGEDTLAGLTRLDQVLAAEGGDVLLLMAGTNDISRGLSLETIRFNLDQMAQRATARGLTTVHATVIPRVPDALRGDGDNFFTQRLAWQIRDLANSRGRDLADPFEVFGSHPNPFAEIYSPGSDPVGHPNAAGFDLLAEIFFDVVRDVDSVPPVPGALEPPDGAERVSSRTQIHVRLFDFGAGIDQANTDLLVDGEPVPASMEGDSRRLDLRYSPVEPLSGVVEVGYRARDLAPTPNQRERILGSFLVQGAQLLQADVNGDGRVDGADLVALARHFGSVNGDSRYARFVDLNRDNRIDGSDLAVLASQFGRSAE